MPERVSKCSCRGVLVCMVTERTARNANDTTTAQKRRNKNPSELVLSPFLLLKGFFLLPSASVYEGLCFSAGANELCLSVRLPWVTHLSLPMSNLGFSLRYLPFEGLLAAAAPALLRGLVSDEALLSLEIRLLLFADWICYNVKYIQQKCLIYCIKLFWHLKAAKIFI